MLSMKASRLTALRYVRMVTAESSMNDATSGKNRVGRRIGNGWWALACFGGIEAVSQVLQWLADGGIVVRNSIILVDFIELRLREGMALSEAVIDAGAVRFRPMLLTAMAVIVGAAVILADPIFQGLAIALMAGEVASLLISRMAVPVLYYMFNRHKSAERGDAMASRAVAE